MPLVPQIRNWNIYKMITPSDRVYIGMTSNINKRKASYSGLDCKSQPLLFNAIHKYGFDSLNFEVIDNFEGTLSEAKSKEMFWIRTNMSNYCKYPDQNGLNLTDGGQGTLGYKLSDLQKENISKRNTGYKHTEEAKKKISDASLGNSWNKGIKRSKEHIEALSKSNIGNKYNLGRIQSQKTKDKRAAKLKGRDRGQEYKNKLSNILIIKLGKKIEQYDINNNFVKEYDSISVAVNELGVWRSVIKHALKNGTFSTKLKSYFKYKI